MRNSRIEVRPIAGSIGAEIDGVDIGDGARRRRLSPRSARRCNEHCVIFFRDQEFDAEQHKAFARRFGEIFIHPNYRGMQADDEIVMVTREPGDQHIVGEDWHADTTMVAEPPMGAILYAIEVPPYGGDTCFANQYLAYETLSDGHEADAGGAARGAQRPHGRRPAGRAQRLPLDQGARGRRTGARRSAPIRWCARIRRPAASCCSSTLLHGRLRGHDRGGEPAVARLPAGARSPARNSPAASAGRTARWRSGTTALSSTSRCTTPARIRRLMRRVQIAGDAVR